ncbi:MAG: hypothetical protein FWG71_00010 [Synergistaceae bacterium]|nr:hypothetical protein [Synergistaceae bacterium]
MVDETEFRNRHFETRGIIEPIARVAGGYKKQQDQRELVHSMRLMLEAVLQSQKKETGKAKSIERTVWGDVEGEGCEIQYNTYRSYMGLKRRVTRAALAKFAVGLGLSLDDANKLFRLQGGELNETNDFDYITIHALMDKDNIMVFMEEVEKYTAVKIRRA